MGLLRFLLAVSVIATHSTAILGVSLLSGNYAVEVFFVISGFYMSLVLSGKYAGEGGTRSFYLNRWLRLYPTYLCVLLATWAYFVFACWHLGRSPTNNWVQAYRAMPCWSKGALIFANWSMVGLDLPSLFHFSPASGFRFEDGAMAFSTAGCTWLGDMRTIGQAWSLGAEIWFYLLAPSLLRWNTPVIGAVLVGSLGLKLWLELGAGFATYFFFPAQLCWFLAGVILYRYYKSKWFRPLPQRFSLLLYLGLLVTFLAYSWTKTPLKTLAIFPLLGLAIPYLFDATRLNRLDRKLGELSYPIYLVHMLVLTVMLNGFRCRSGAAVMLFSVLFALAICKWVDGPIDELRQAHVRGRKETSKQSMGPVSPKST